MYCDSCVTGDLTGVTWQPGEQQSQFFSSYKTNKPNVLSHTQRLFRYWMKNGSQFGHLVLCEKSFLQWFSCMFVLFLTLIFAKIKTLGPWQNTCKMFDRDGSFATLLKSDSAKRLAESPSIGCFFFFHSCNSNISLKQSGCYFTPSKY